MQKKAIGFCVFFLYASTALTAQVIYFGGKNDGFAKATFSQPDPASDIYSGGINDGFAISSYIEPDPSNDIYRGGINDGFAKSSYSEPDPSSDIYSGGVNDGFAFNSYIESDPASDIYAGGINDGFAFNSYSESDPNSDIYAGGINDGFAQAYFNEELSLPVTWKYFTITKKDGRPLLRWSTDKEEKCLSYQVLRSNDGKDFESIDEIACEGKAIDNEYEFVDISLLWHHIYYYKIAQYDIDGEFTSSEVKSYITTEPSQPEVYYQNGQLIVKTDREAKLRSISVFDFTGRTLSQQFANMQAESYYRFDCLLSSNQLVIIRLTFDTFTHTTHMRIGDR